MPSLNAQSWLGFFKQTCCKQVERFYTTIEARVLPAFSKTEDETEAEGKEAYDTWPGYSEDPEAGVDYAEAIRQDYYDSMKGVEQALLNLSAAGLFHLVEQRLLFYLRRANPKFNQGEPSQAL